MRIVEDYLQITPDNWHTKKLDIDNPVHMARFIARYKYAFPGMYELCALVDDGAVICSVCVRKEYRQIIHDTKHEWNTGWRVVGIVSESEMENEFCAHCDKPLGYHEEEGDD